ncbi:hypothetical protein BAR24_01175 [Gluconobacter oxydans]|nr:hypothetical protein BAR24_01175 [Gluconobacter oxydans]
MKSCIYQLPVQLLPACRKSGITKPQGIFLRMFFRIPVWEPSTLPAAFRDDEADIIESIPVGQISHIHAAFYQRRQDRAIASR